jgi:hypothetical protein
MADRVMPLVAIQGALRLADRTLFGTGSTLLPQSRVNVALLTWRVVSLAL